MNLARRTFFSLSRVTWRETLVLMAMAWLVPFLVHILPWSGARPLGVHLLPAFWTAFVAVYLYGGAIGVVVALVVPVANLLTTGLPSLERTGLMTVELVAFVGVSAFLIQRWPAFRLAAPLAWLPAKALTSGLQWLLPVFAYTRNPFDHFVSSTRSCLAGLGVLLAINATLVALLPKDQDWDSE